MHLKEKTLKQRDLSEKNIYLSFPKIIGIDTGNICNYNCVFCMQSKHTNKVGCIEKKYVLRL